MAITLILVFCGRLAKYKLSKFSFASQGIGQIYIFLFWVRTRLVKNEETNDGDVLPKSDPSLPAKYLSSCGTRFMKSATMISLIKSRTSQRILRIKSKV